MASRLRTGLAVLVILAVALPTFFRGLTWGLPSRESDRWLFGERPVWTGAEIIQRLTGDGAAAPNRGADVDASPIGDRSKPIVLNDTDAKRAAIIQRYRLMSRQPDEFIQFKALAEMSQRTGLARLDPRLYQYGGLWIYPVGAAVRGAMAIGWIDSPPAGTSAREFYLDQPEMFGKFYVIARGYSAMWGTIAALAVYAIARGATANLLLAVLAAVAFILLPVVQTAAHEAKPHLAGAALCLLAVIAATRFIESGRRRWLLASGALCGAAMGMVISMVLSLAVLPVMVWLRMKNPPPTTGEREPSFVRSLAVAVGAALLVFALTNPFVIINAITAPHLLRSNLGNSTAMYGVRGASAMIPDALRILGHAATPIGVRILIAAAVALLIARAARKVQLVAPPRPRSEDGATSCSLLVAPAVLVLIQFVLLAAGKPAEYARFSLLVVAAGCVAVAIAISAAVRSPARFGLVLLGTLLVALLIPSPRGQKRIFDAWNWPDEIDETALQLDTMRQNGLDERAGYRMGVAYEPAPWSSPPINLFDQQVILVRMEPAMLDTVDAVVWPLNLESQLFPTELDRESLDWRQPRWGMRAESRDGLPERWHGGW